MPGMSRSHAPSQMGKAPSLRYPRRVSRLAPGRTRLRIPPLDAGLAPTVAPGLASGLATCLVFCLCWGLSCSSEPPPRSILLITVDTLRADHLGIYGYPRSTSPNIDRWFADAAIFERSYSTEARTPQSVTSILSGRLPQEHRVRKYWQLVPDEIRLIPDLLPEAHQKAAFVSNAVLVDKAIGIADRFEHYDEDFDRSGPDGRNTGERDARATTDAVLRWLREERDPDRPFFVWIHYMDPHIPYRPPEEWSAAFSHDEPALVPRSRFSLGMFGKEVDGPPVDARDFVDAYDAEIAFMDHEIGRLLDTWAELESLDDSLMLLTADHGEALMEYEMYFGHGYQVYESIIHVPLLVRGPGVRSARHPGLTSGIDVLPTVLAFAGGASPEELPGIDLSGPAAIPPERIVYAETTFAKNTWRTAIRAMDKWMLRIAREGDIAEWRHYDLAADVGEEAPRPWSAGASGGDRLLELLAKDPDRAGPARIAAPGGVTGPNEIAPRVSEEELETLRALGYVGD